MNGHKAKSLRMMVYGLRRHEKEHPSNDRKLREYMRDTKTGTILCSGSRSQYKKLKEAYRKWKKAGMPK